MSKVVLSNITKAYGKNQVLCGIDLVLEQGGIYCLMAPSGSGKTTLFRIMLGLEQADRGRVEGVDVGSVSAMFQEDRLCEALNPVENVLLLLPKGALRRDVHALLAEVLPLECLAQPVCELSGGMRRRVSLARAMAFPGSFVVLDEPFTGLDFDTRRRTIEFILRHQRGRCVLLATHGTDDAALLGAQLVQLDQINKAVLDQEGNVMA